MSLLNEILKWTESLPNWQRDAARRLFQNEQGLSEAEYLEIYTLFKKENGIAVEGAASPEPLASKHLPATVTAGEIVTLVALRDLQNVNQIPNDCVVTFSETGITVIYGGNGSGKSGYARVMKRACRARDQSDPIHPNANDVAAATKVPRAKFVVKLAGVTEEIEWVRDATPPDRLSMLSVFDSKCARSYITAEKDVAYLPYGLDVVENLANLVLPKISGLLDAEINGIDVDKLPFQHLVGETQVGKVIEALSAKSDASVISKLGVLTEEEYKRIAELETALKENDPLAKAKELRLSALRLKTYANKLTQPLIWVSAEAIEKLKKLSDKKESAEEAEAKAAESLRAGEVILPGTGGQVWKLLFEAARRYSTEVAYPGEEFPSSEAGKVCPLCQENLGDGGIRRLKRFNEYIKNDIAKLVDEARKSLELAKGKIEQANLQVGPDEAMGDELCSLDSKLLQDIDDFQVSIESRRSAMLNCLATREWAKLPELVESPRGKIRKLAAGQLKAYRTLVRAADEEKKKKLSIELNELNARNGLSKSLKAVLDLLQRIKRRASLEKCKLSLKTRAISDKSKEFATVAVTKELKTALDVEFKALGIGHIKTKLKERSSKGKMLHQLVLDLPTTAKIDEILSEGEQRAIALGSFFAELSLANHSCGIVFDDPVSSLDHWRRRDVAKRLCAEAKKRQVIVFTHDTSFLGQLCDEIELTAIPSSMSFLVWRGGLPGRVNYGLPWDHQGYKARINSLEQHQSKLVKAWPVYPGENETIEIRHQYDRLRATLERVIQDVVFNGVVKRYRDWIRVDSLEDVVGFNQSEYKVIDELHKKCSDVVTAHDPSSAKAAPVPTAVELGVDIATLKSLVDAIKSRRSVIKAAAT